MTIEPIHLSQGIDYLGFLAKELGDLQGTKSLAHELIQNADDAKNEAGDFVAREIIFDVTDEALVITNDATFRNEDFKRMQTIAAGAKREELGRRTTGAFGVGFISVYQVTDHPEILSAGRRWVFHPQALEGDRILEYPDQSTPGTLFRLPWAFEDSETRQKLRARPLTKSDLSRITSDLTEALPATLIFLKSLERVELRRNGQLVTVVKRVGDSGRVLIERANDGVEAWTFIQGEFGEEGDRQKRIIPMIEKNRSANFQIAIPDSPLDTGLLYATLPTEQLTGLPFHLNADFFPDSDRKAIALGADYRSEWNRAAIRAAATALGSSVELLLRVFHEAPETLWFFLERVHHVSVESANDSRRPLHLFWRELSATLPRSSIVFTDSMQWLAPNKVRIPTGPEQEQAVPVLAAIGIETIHPTLRRYRNILTSGEIGVQIIRPQDIHDALAHLDLVDESTSLESLPEPYRSEAGILAFWRTLEAVIDQSRPNTKQAENLLEDCALAPCLDGKLWPFYQAYRADAKTVSIFSSLLPNVSFLKAAFLDDPLANRLCPLFTAEDAVEELAALGSAELEEAWEANEFSPRTLLHWFEEHSAEVLANTKLRSDLAALPVFPSGKQLRILTELALPGGFTDELGLSELVDTDQLDGLGDFLRKLGAQPLTFAEYARRYIPQGFLGSELEAEKKRRVISLLIEHLGAIREDREVRRALAVTALIECQDKVWRAPTQAYLDTDDVRLVFGASAPYALLPGPSRDSTQDLYEWLGVATVARPRDILAVIEELTLKPPTTSTKKSTGAIVESIGRLFPRFNPEEREQFSSLKSKDWLPAEEDITSWRSAGDLFATFRKYLFASQAIWLDIPLPGQQAAVSFLSWLGVRFEPSVALVVQHLLKCASDDLDVNPEVYAFLNGADVTDIDLEPLRAVACLRMGGHYVRPHDAFWGPHPFGRFRVSLGPELKRFGKFLDSVGVGQAPDHSDAILVLQEMALEADQPLEADNDIVLQCWVMLGDALQTGAILDEELDVQLRNVRCVPNKRAVLYSPASIYFEDRPGLAEKFHGILENNTIPRPERAWPAMAAAGVRPVSEVVVASLAEVVDPSEDEGLQERIRERRSLIKSIAAGGSMSSTKESIPLEDLRFIEASAIHIQWTLNAFQQATTERELADAYLERDARAIYFSRRGQEPPWSAIARELALAIEPGAEVRTISPGLKTVLQAADEAEAQAELNDLGISSIHEVAPLSEPSSSAINDFDSVAGEAGQTDEHNGLDGADIGPPPPPVPTAGAPIDEVPLSTFMRRLFEAQAPELPPGADMPIQLPVAGPNTQESAARHTAESSEFGRAGGPVRRSVTWWTPRPAAQQLAEEFRAMAFGDYSKRCQICSRTFSMANGGDHQTFVIHLVEPSKDPGTNHFGNLASLCGWHYALIQYGRWTFIDPQTGSPPATPQLLRQLLLNAERKMDEAGNDFYSVPIRFSDVYENWESSPLTQREELRYSEPHWLYLRALLGGEQVT